MHRLDGWQLIYRPDTGEILGVHILGLHAADLIHEASNAIAMGNTIKVCINFSKDFTMRRGVRDFSFVVSAFLYNFDNDKSQLLLQSDLHLLFVASEIFRTSNLLCTPILPYLKFWMSCSSLLM